MTTVAADRVAVTLHDITPSSFGRIALVRDWLDDLGVERATLLVVPASDLHPLQDHSEPLVAWLEERRARGDVIAQQGLRNRCDRRPSRLGRARGGMLGIDPAAEFAYLSPSETSRAVEAGWRILRLAGLEPSGFVAPGYAYTQALHAVLSRRFAWWAGSQRLYGPGSPADGTPLAAPVELGARPAHRCGLLNALRRHRSEPQAGELLRLDLRTGGLDARRDVVAVEQLLGVRHRTAVTLDELELSARPSAA
ncbi:unannotated protein [freshwater metagenome]|uniref:Unannotated protein n=1 Tax=freshwater metagenome TaxID=449393 RepID=A0A6J7HFW2_9ZZZZ|nr:DUF2334 domain-containing protein [Actinomycetota bacterium]